MTLNTDKPKELIQRARRGHAAESESLEKRQTTSRVLRNGNERRGRERRRDEEDRKREKRTDEESRREHKREEEEEEEERAESREIHLSCARTHTVSSRFASGHGAQTTEKLNIAALHVSDLFVKQNFATDLHAFLLIPMIC